MESAVKVGASDRRVRPPGRFILVTERTVCSEVSPYPRLPLPLVRPEAFTTTSAGLAARM